MRRMTAIDNMRATSHATITELPNMCASPATFPDPLKKKRAIGTSIQFTLATTIIVMISSDRSHHLNNTLLFIASFGSSLTLGLLLRAHKWSSHYIRRSRPWLLYCTSPVTHLLITIVPAPGALFLAVLARISGDTMPVIWWMWRRPMAKTNGWPISAGRTARRGWICTGKGRRHWNCIISALHRRGSTSPT